ncbi:MAG: T9SS type A sorting domain-containing protein [Bacteroidetes bacterium]|nr:T9SS type A sorting domain-containing protein [Bacteroidota bacterium]
MKKHLFSALLLMMGSSAFAQQEIYALTGMQSPNIVFKDFRALDLKSGQTKEVIFSKESNAMVLDNARNTVIAETKGDYNNAQANAIAAMALDATGTSLVYMPMYSNQFYALDLKTKNITRIDNSVAKAIPCDINSHFTRMATGTDGAIYTLNNSGSQLLKIEKQNGEYHVKDLGSVMNDESNGENKLQIMNIGFGGDMVADKDNNFYIFSASGHVFVLNSLSKVAKFIGKVNGLPENYSLNGAAANENGAVVVGSAKGGDLYEVQVETLQAKPIYGGVQHQIYDLASKYVIGKKGEVNTWVQNDIYPTKVSEGEVTIQLEPKLAKSLIKAEVYNAVGTKVLEKSMSNQRILSLEGLPQGMYLIHILGEKGDALVSKKVLVVQ